MTSHADHSQRVPLERGQVDLASRQLLFDGEVLATLTPTEQALMALLVARAGEAVTRRELLRDVWGYRDGVRSRTIDTTMRRLRRKVELVPGVPRHLLTVDGVGYRFVPLSSLDLEVVRRHPLDPILGRQTERGWLERLAEQGARLLSIVGPPGVGKSRLARDWLCSKRVLEVPLGESGGAASVLEAIAAAASTSADSSAELAARLSSRGVEWLFLDQATHRVAEVGRVAQAFAGTDLRVVVTSRRALGRAGDTRIDLAPLSVEAGVQLLRLRAPGSLGEADEEVLTEIVARLDSLPLALEMAAARAALMGAHGLRDHLATPENLLELTSPEPGRGSLRAIGHACLESLSESAAESLGRLAAFEGGFTVEAAVAAVGRSDALARLQELRDHSCLYPYRARVGDDARQAPDWQLVVFPPVRELLRQERRTYAGAERRLLGLRSAGGGEAGAESPARTRRRTASSAPRPLHAHGAVDRMGL